MQGDMMLRKWVDIAIETMEEDGFSEAWATHELAECLWYRATD